MSGDAGGMDMDGGWLEELARIAEGDEDPDALERLVDGTDLDHFLHGRCHLMAVALHEASGLPIHAYVDGDGEGRAWLVHAFVVDGEDAIDVRGRRPVEDVLDDFDWTDPELVGMSSEEVLRWGEGRKRLPAESRRALDEARAAAPHLMRLAGLARSSSPAP